MVATNDKLFCQMVLMILLESVVIEACHRVDPVICVEREERGERREEDCSIFTTEGQTGRGEEEARPLTTGPAGLLFLLQLTTTDRREHHEAAHHTRHNLTI